jgi:hypothetical protein
MSDFVFTCSIGGRVDADDEPAFVQASRRRAGFSTLSRRRARRGT